MQDNVSDYLIRSVEKRDISNIRGALLGIIDKNPQNIDTIELSNALGYVRKTISDQQLFEENDTSFDDPDSANDYYYALSSLKQNFSREKLQRVVSLGGRKHQSTHFQAPNTRQHTASDTYQHRGCKSNNNHYEYTDIGQNTKSGSDDSERKEHNHPFRGSTMIIAGVVVLIAVIGIVILVKVLESRVKI